MLIGETTTVFNLYSIQQRARSLRLNLISEHLAFRGKGSGLIWA